MTVRDGTEGWYYDGPRGWVSYQMSDEEWQRRRLIYGVGIKTNGKGNKYTGHLSGRTIRVPREPFAGKKPDHRE